MRMIKAVRASAALGAFFLGSIVFVSVPAAAWQEQPDRLMTLNYGFGGANYYYCYGLSREGTSDVWGVTEIVDTDARVTLYQMLAALDQAADPFPGRPWSVRCTEDSAGGSTFSTRAQAEATRNYFMDDIRSRGHSLVEIPWPGKPGWSSKSAVAARKPAANKSAPEPSNSSGTRAASAPSRYVEIPGPNGPIRLSPEVAARNKAAADEYRRKVEEHARVTAERARAMAEHDRRIAEHRQNAAKAASAEEQYQREVAAAGERVAAHRVAMAEHAKKVAGASTNDDPNRCITSPAIKPGLRGNTEVRVTNGCDQKVDIVICLKRTSGDWLCGANFGILSQRSMTFMSTNATGEIYVDAVTFGSGNKLGRPAGVIK